METLLLSLLALLGLGVGFKNGTSTHLLNLHQGESLVERSILNGLLIGVMGAGLSLSLSQFVCSLDQTASVIGALLYFVGALAGSLIGALVSRGKVRPAESNQ